MRQRNWKEPGKKVEEIMGSDASDVMRPDGLLESWFLCEVRMIRRCKGKRWIFGEKAGW